MCRWAWRRRPGTHQLRIEATSLLCVSSLQSERTGAINRAIGSGFDCSPWWNLQSLCCNICRDLRVLFSPWIVMDCRVVRAPRLRTLRRCPASVDDRWAHHPQVAGLLPAGYGVEGAGWRAEVFLWHGRWRWRWRRRRRRRVNVADNRTSSATLAQPEEGKY